MTRSAITTHILDTARGKPASGVAVELFRCEGGQAVPLAKGATNEDGRVTDLLPPGPLPASIYRLTFDVKSYFEARGEPAFYPLVTIDFEVREEAEHYHVPLLLSPFGYSTYRGS
jgi:5-hydroxyisourate hydrolase